MSWLCKSKTSRTSFITRANLLSYVSAIGPSFWDAFSELSEEIDPWLTGYWAKGIGVEFGVVSEPLNFFTSQYVRAPAAATPKAMIILSLWSVRNYLTFMYEPTKQLQIKYNIWEKDR